MTTQLSSPTLKSSDATQVSQGKKGRCFSGARPTGRQHLGNYLGAIQNYILLQNDYDCLYFNTDVLIEPEMKSTQVSKVLGIDGQQKMSKSLNNHIELASTPEETTQRVMQEPFRLRRAELASDPSYVRDVLADGKERAKTLPEKTMQEVRAAVGLP